MAIVIPAPSKRLINGLEVTFFKVCSSFPPAIFSRFCDITCMPNRKNTSPKTSISMCDIKSIFL